MAKKNSESGVYRVTEIIGTSPVSWEAAAKSAVETAAKAQKRFDDEDAKRQKLSSGVLGLDMYNMREPLAKAGLIYVDNPEDA